MALQMSFGSPGMLEVQTSGMSSKHRGTTGVRHGCWLLALCLLRAIVGAVRRLVQQRSRGAPMERLCIDAQEQIHVFEQACPARALILPGESFIPLTSLTATGCF